MNDLITIIRNRHESLEKKIQKLKDYLTDDRKIVIERELFSAAIVDVISQKGNFINEQAVQIYLILHHCIKHYSAISEKKEKLSFQNVMKILDEAVNRFVTPQYFYKLINFRDQSSESTLLHQAVISNNTDSIKALLKYGADPLIKDKNEQIPLDLAQGDTKKVLIEC
ncbi:MAG: ankyrin repeat domain-containing protein, partial [Wolbachia pipientis]